MRKKRPRRPFPMSEVMLPAWAVVASVRANRIEALVDSLPDPWRATARALTNWKYRGHPLPGDPDLYLAQACLQWIIDLGIRPAEHRQALREVAALIHKHRRLGRPPNPPTAEQRRVAREEYQRRLQAGRTSRVFLGEGGRKQAQREIAAKLGFGSNKKTLAALFNRPRPSRILRLKDLPKKAPLPAARRSV